MFVSLLLYFATTNYHFRIFCLSSLAFVGRYYRDSDHAKELEGIDMGKYVASSIVVFNLDTRQVKWAADLDLSTDAVNFRAHVFSSPTVVDLDGDGYLDILIGTAYGLFYVIDHRGKFLVS